MRLFILVPLVLTLAAAPASATTVAVEDDAVAGLATLKVVDEAAEQNTLTVSYTYEPADGPLSVGRATITVRDTTAPLEPGEGCQAHGAFTVRCVSDRLWRIDAALGGADDTAAVESPPGTSCDCVTLRGEAGADRLTSLDGAALDGGDGDDLLNGRPSTAKRTRDNLVDPSSDALTGGNGNDTLDGGTGDDSLFGGAGDDTVRGADGDDFLNGGASVPLDGAPPPAGWDELDGGPGDDDLNDGDDASGQVTPDRHLGGTGVDAISSYRDRDRRVRAILTRRGGQGAGGEHDSLVNVETVYGGRGNDTLEGDGDANQLFGLGGSNEVRGRGGDDYLTVGGGRQLLSGDRGDDTLAIETWTTGPVRCGTGRDRVVLPERGGPDSPRRPRENDPGASVAPDCEAISRPGGWGIDPVPNKPVSASRRLTFDKPRGFIARDRFTLTVTSASRPYRALATGTSRSDGITVRLPRSVARKARRDGMTFRAEVHEALYATPRLQLVWRFRVKPAR